MPKIPSLNGFEMLRALLKADFYVHHQTGSHARLFHQYDTKLRVTIPIHRTDLPEWTVKSILRQANLTEPELIELLKQ